MTAPERHPVERYRISRRQSLVHDNDDLSVELDDLSVAQAELRKELHDVVSVIEFMSEDPDNSNDELDENGSHYDPDFVEESYSVYSMSTLPVEEDLDFSIRSTNTTRGRERSRVHNGEYLRTTRLSFSKAFFIARSLEAEKRDKIRTVREQLKTIDEELHSSMIIQQEKQQMIVDETKMKIEEEEKIKQTLCNLDRSQIKLEREKKKQMGVLRENLKRIDSSLVRDMEEQRREWDKIIQTKKIEQITKRRKTERAAQ